MADDDVVEITAPVEFKIVGDRLHFTLVSGRRRHPYSISFHKARGAAQVAVALLDQHAERKNVHGLERKRPAHG